MPSLPASRFKYSPHDSFRNYLPKDNLTGERTSILMLIILLKMTMCSTFLSIPWLWLNYYVCTDIVIYNENRQFALWL